MSTTPYQAAIVDHSKNAYPGLFCGGSITEDMRHIITAAHCVFDNSLSAEGQPVAPDALDVIVGTPSLNGYSGGGTRIGVVAVSFDDDFDSATFSHDAAILTLDGSLQRSAVVDSISLVGPLEWDASQQPNATAAVSGWGETRSNDPTSYPHDLQMATLPIVPDATCKNAYQGFDAPAMTCAGNATVDSCFGDSGGPLVVDGVDAPIPRLLGIVSFGPPSGCAIANYPGVYTEVYDASISAYLAQANPMSAPRTLLPPSVEGTVAVGSTVSCNPGTWEGMPSFSYQFVVPTPSGDVARTAQGAQSSYTIQAADAGNPLACNVKGTNAGGLAYAESAAVTVPVPESPQPQPQPPNQFPSQNQLDTAAPVARVTKTTCTATRCTLTVAVTDAGFSAGIKTVQASVRSTYRSRCTRKGTNKTVACTKHRTIKPSVAALTSTRFKIVASKLPYGTQRFTLVAVDKAGHRQSLPTTKTVTTKKPRTRR